MSEKVRKARTWLREQDKTPHDQYMSGIILAALAEPDVCGWRKKYGVYVTECDHELLLEHGEIAAMEFCPFKGCGKRIEVRE